MTDSGADKRPLPSNASPKQAATLEQKRSLQALTPSARVPSRQGRSLADLYRVPASEFIIDNTEFLQCDLHILPFLDINFERP